MHRSYRIKRLGLSFSFLFSILCIGFAGSTPLGPEPLPTQVGVWDLKLGNHRVLLNVTEAAPAVAARIDWRRVDRTIETKNLKVVHLASGREIANRVVVANSREYGEVIFDASAGAGEYVIYTHQPMSAADAIRSEMTEDERAKAAGKKSSTQLGYKRADLHAQFPLVRYVAPQDTASKKWLKAQKLEDPAAWNDRFVKLPKSEVVALESLAVSSEIEATRSRNVFDAMETICTAEEYAALMKQVDPSAGFLVFPEDRDHPIKMRRDLPYRWVARGPGGRLEEQAQPGEYVVFQMGVHALAGLQNLRVSFSDLAGPKGKVPADALNCFNIEGNDWLGHPATYQVDVESGRVQAMWCGVQLPMDLPAGRYEGRATVQADGFPAQQVPLTFEVAGEALADGGDSDSRRLSRLRWLNSTRGAEAGDIVQPFVPLERTGHKINLLGRTIELADGGLPAQVTSFIDMYDIRKDGRSLMAEPARMQVLDAQKKPLVFDVKPLVFVEEDGANITFKSEQQADGVVLRGEGTLGYDGYIRYRYTLEADRPVKLADLALVLPMLKDAAPYANGSLCTAGFRPDTLNKPILSEGSGDIGLMYQSFWTGDYNVGLGCILKNHDDEWNAENETKKILPIVDSWSNRSKGSYQIKEAGSVARISVHTGPVEIGPDSSYEVNFALLATPFKPIRRDRWEFRVTHLGPGKDPDLKSAEQAGTRVANLHHGSTWNRHINYPYVAADALREYVKETESKGMTVKLYNTVRELSTRPDELWAIRSFGDEILIDDDGYETYNELPVKEQTHRFNRTGNPWMCEHLRDHYRTRWHTQVHPLDPELESKVGRQHDSALAVQGLSRWHNHYIEGMYWLRKETGVRGVYLDGIGYDRAVIQRLRKAMEVPGLPPGQIDFHGAVHNAWLQLSPYIDHIWFGEGARYPNDYAYWLVEVSGIPYGLTGEILSSASKADSNLFRGMLYGMVRRHGWNGGIDSAAVWKLWDSFDIQNAQWRGFWDKSTPVKTDHPDIKATVYQHRNRSLIVLGSWAKEDAQVNLKVDWKALGLDPTKVRISAPELELMQPAREFAVGEAIKVSAGQGVILLVQ